ncbi:MAG: methyltransferase domain-containing protein [Magnetococcales bacterium]|nr:methyltransferase domain-containing protein [Magnetococcales bacterium]
MKTIPIVQSVQTYYGQTLSSSQDLKTSSCCSAEALPDSAKEVAPLIADEIVSKFYGCGSPIPPLLEGCTVVDLGCGTGRDAYIMAKLVGQNGQVIGVDMTPEQLNVALKYRDEQMSRFGFDRTNIDFRLGQIEDLKALDIADNSVDVITSNCVLNLSGNKEAVFSEIHRILKPGGELYFSDVFTARRVPEALHNDPILLGECLSGALYIDDFRRLMEKVGLLDYRVVSSKPITLDDPKVYEKIGMVDFFSKTIRAFKIDSLEDRCEDYGQIATYKGTLPQSLHYFDLDSGTRFLSGKPQLVCGNTAAMLQKSRYSPHFTVMGDTQTHFGPFDCGCNGAANSVSPNSDNDKGNEEINSSSSGGCC